MDKEAKFPYGSWVRHINHGHGTVIGYDDSDDGIIVHFDIKPKGWDEELCVSAGCLTMIKRV